MSKCLFCSIASGKTPAEIIFENDTAVAFRDSNPQAPHHVLVIPRKHISNYLNIEKADAEILISMAQAVSEVVKNCRIEKSGFRIVINNGPDAGQAVDHLHFHLLGGRKLQWPPG